jgi:molybdopterin molybdotransferase
MTNNLISVADAKALVVTHCKPLQPVEISIADALQTVLAKDVFAAIDMPSFNQSAMDGYAFCFADYEAGKSLEVVGESFAGNSEISQLQTGTCIRIFTGAPVPVGADTVVMQEHTKRTGDQLMIDSPNITKGLNVRSQGSEINKGSLALEAGSLITPAAIGYLASVGISIIPVYNFPKVSIITTGKELVQTGNPLALGQVYESNSLTLKAALQQLQVATINIQWVDDNIDEMIVAVQQALNTADLVLITGGVSVGDYDYVIPALKACDVTTIFHKVKQRPGKPLYFGKKDNKIVFGLPGNPSSVLSCYYNYVLPAIQQLMHRNEALITTRQLPLAGTFTKPKGLAHFLKGAYVNEQVKHLAAQESFRLSSFALANCLIEIPENAEVVNTGEMVTVHVIN